MSSEILELRSRIHKLTNELFDAYAKLTELCDPSQTALYSQEEMAKIAINEVPEVFSTKDVLRYIRVKFNPAFRSSSNLGHRLKILSKQTPNIELLESSRGGSSPNMYRRISPYNLDFLIK